MLLTALSGSCVEPQFGSGAEGDADSGGARPSTQTERPDTRPRATDASNPVEPDAKAMEADQVAAAHPDAGVPSDAATPWHAALAPHYAVSIRFYSKDRGLADQAIYSHELILRAEVSVDDAGKVTMVAQRCLDHGNVLAVGLKDDFEVIHPELLTAQTFELVVRPDGLRTEAPGRRHGFVAQPTECTPGTRMRVPDRPWLRDGMCECRATALPTLADDCRIVDEDKDNKAGISLQHRGLRNDIEPARLLDSSQIVAGVLTPDGRIRASYLENYDSIGLDCGASPCSQTAIAVCPLMLNPVLFEPLAASSDCASVLAEQAAGRLFQLPTLTFVSGC